MKKNVLALSVSAAFSYPAFADILITEYIEGTSSNKAIEIANTGLGTVTLTGYTLEKDGNGSGNWSEKLDLKDITLTPNQTYVFVNNNASDELKAKANLIDGGITAFNGDDPVALKKGGVIVDIVGDASRGNILENSIIRRKIFTASSQYDEAKFDYISDLSDYSGLGNLDIKAPVPKPKSTIATVQEIQGIGWSSTIGGIDVPNEKYDSGDNYFEVSGIVTAIQKNVLKKGLPVGFTMQAPDDGDPLTSDGIVVETKMISDLEVGTMATVIAKVKEDYGLTKLFEVYSVANKGRGTLPSAISLKTIDSDIDDSGQLDFDRTLERHEGMLVRFDELADMRVARTFGYDHSSKRNNMVVSHGGINLHPNQNNIPGSDEAIAQRESNKDRRVTIESFTKAPEGQIPWYPEFARASAVPMANGTTTSDDYIRIGDTLDGLEGVLSYHYNEFHLYVTNKASKETFIHNIPRTETPVIEKGGLRIGTMNVLNYFNSPFTSASCNPQPPGSRDSVKDTECNNRGASSLEEFELQGDKIAAAVVAMDADILGLMEIENNGFGEDSAVAHLVDKINALISDRAMHYVYVKGSSDEKYIGSDAIANQVIYRPAKVQLDNYRLIEMPSQQAEQTQSSNGQVKEDGKNYQRDGITPTFVIKGTNPEQKITVSVNHFKSKGSTCWEDVAPEAQNGVDTDNQGSCENLRVSAAQHLGTELSNGENADNTIILGDLNSYGSEDPMLLLTTLPQGYSVTPARDTKVGDNDMDGSSPAPLTDSFGFVNVIKEKHSNSFSYSYNDEVGTLDYILVSPALKNKVREATEWNINSVESSLFQYSGKYTGDLEKFKDLFRSSDHDPALITLDLGNQINPLRSPVIPPKAPISPPANVKEIPQAIIGQTVKVLFDLTNLDIDLHIGDKATVSFSQFTSYSAADTKATGDTATVILDKSMIEQGWVALEVEISQPGDYQMTKSVIDGVTHKVMYLSHPTTVSVVEPPRKKRGGSVGGLAILSLLGAAVLRRKVMVNK